MKTVSVSWAKNNLSALLRQIRGGATVTITDHGLPVARVMPPASTKGIPPAAIELAQRGLLILPEHEATVSWEKGLPPAPRLREGVSVLAALLDEREGGR